MAKGSWLAPIAGVIAVAAVILVGCGGGGGGSSSGSSASGGSNGSTNGGSNGNTGLTVGPMLVAVNSANKIVDPTNLQAGNRVTFEVVTINAGTLVVSPVQGARFSTSDSSGVAGSLNSNSGVFIANNVSSVQSFTMTGRVGLQAYSALYAVNPVQATVTGSVMDTNGNSVPFAVVTFYDANSNQVGTCKASLDGSFSASVPTSAVRFGFAQSSIPPAMNPSNIPSMGYFQVFYYGNGTYNFSSSCGAPLPALTVGQVTPLPNSPTIAAAFSVSGAAITPPPPAGCTP